MRISSKQLMHMPVVTVSGVRLGKVYDLLFDTEMLSLAHIDVRSRLHPSRSHSISRDQIVSISESIIVVSDAAVEDTLPKKVRCAVPIMMRSGSGDDML